MDKYKVAALTSHPIQYQAPLFKKITEHPQIDLMVYFSWDFGVKDASYDSEFGRKLKWDIPVLQGYKYKFLTNYSPKPSSNFWGQINPGIIRELAVNKYDAVIIFGWNSFSNWLAFITAFISKTPVFLRGENPLNQEWLKPAWKRRVKKVVFGWLFKRVSAFLYIGEENKKFYEYYGVPNEKLVFCPYAVDNERFIATSKALSAKRKALKEELGVDDKDIIILFAGKLIEKKRPFDLLRAFNLLNSKFHILNSSLIFVGDGPLRPELEKYVEEQNINNVHFVGFKNQTEMPGYYTLADIFILPSGIGETWGLAINEAMCFRLPVIGSDLIGCGPDLIRHRENGYIFPVGNIEKLAEYLADLIKNPQKRKSFGKKSFEIIQNYGYQKDIEGISKVLAASS